WPMCDETAGGVVGRPADGARRRDWLGVAATARHRHRRWSCGEPIAHAVHDSGHLSGARRVATALARTHLVRGRPARYAAFASGGVRCTRRYKETELHE